MELNELRIGNYVSHPNRKEDRISGLGTKNWDDFAEFKDYDHVGYYLEFVRPIPLTEEWLLKLKASKIDNDNFYYDRFKLIWKPSYKYWYVVDYMTSTYLTKIEFVHEWQNFVFAMNSEELSQVTSQKTQQ